MTGKQDPKHAEPDASQDTGVAERALGPLWNIGPRLTTFWRT